jgi:alkylation response protein AidB-like acyl-CoA dehydrogenase
MKAVMTAATTRAPNPTAAPADLDTVLSDLTERFSATAAQHDEASSFPYENFRALHAAGLLALTAPIELGGGSADLAAALNVVRAVARGEPATALVLTMQYLFHAHGSVGWPDHLRRRVVRDAVEAGGLINALRVEPDLGTPARGGLPATVARRTDDGWRLSGRKIYSTGAPALSWMMVWARTDDETPVVGGFLVPGRAAGVRIEETWDHTGLRASASHDVVFEGVLIPADHALSPTPVGEVPKIDPEFMVWSSVLISAIYDGVARAARDWFVDWALSRRPSNLGAPLASLPRFQELVGAIDGLLLQNRVLLDAAAAGGVSPVESGLLKHLVTENAIAAVEKAIAVSGNPGLSRRNDLQRHYRDVLCGRVHTPQGDVALAAAGKAAFAAR